MGVFGDWAEKYFKSGLYPIPVNGKKAFTDGWSTFSENEMDDDTLEKYKAKYSSCNVGIVLGKASNLVAFDLDYDMPEWTEKSKLTKEQWEKVKSVVDAEGQRIKEEIKKLLPQTPCIKIGKDGKYCLFYRPKGKFESITMDRYGQRLVDILWNGRQTVMPPSIHPDTNKPYRWTNGDIMKHIDDLPELEWDTVLKIKAMYEKPLSDLFPNEKDRKQVISGRNTAMMKLAWGMFARGMTLNAVITQLLNADQDQNSPPLFSDQEDFPRLYTTPEKAAEKFAKSIQKSFREKMKNDTPPAAKNADEKKTPDQIGFYYRYRIPKDDGGIKTIDQPQYKLMADHVFDKKNMCFDDSKSLTFNGKKWSWLSKTGLNNFIVINNEECIKPQHIDNFVKSIKSSCFYGAFQFKDTDSFINLNNGILNVKTGELLSHSYQYSFKYVSPVDYLPNAQCPKWLAFLERVFEGKKELTELIQKMFGYILIGGDPFLHKSFCLIGSGRNGKSTLLEILKAVVGQNSYSTVSMSKLDKEFSLVSIDGKLANIVEETPNDEINSEAFKTMVAGGEVRAAHKGFDEYSFKCKARFVFACNDMPIFKDRNVSLVDRLIFIPFNRYFEEAERNPFMAQELKAELSGILNWAVKGAEIILRDKRITTGDVVAITKEQYLKESDSIYAWFMDHIKVDVASRGLETKELHAKYKAWCEEDGRNAVSMMRFSKRLKSLVTAECKKLGIQFTDDDTRFYRGPVRVRGCKYIFYL